MLMSLCVAIASFWLPLNGLSLMLAFASCVLNYVLSAQEGDEMSKRGTMVGEGIGGMESFALEPSEAEYSDERLVNPQGVRVPAISPKGRGCLTSAFPSD